MMPAPQIAIAWPCRSRGLMSRSTDCDSGTSAAPKTPCRMRKSTISSRLVAMPQSTEVADEADDADDEQPLPTDPVGEPAGHRRHDRRGDDVGGEHPGDGVLGGAEARCMCGSATLAIVVSSTCMIVASMIETVIRPRCLTSTKPPARPRRSSSALSGGRRRRRRVEPGGGDRLLVSTRHGALMPVRSGMSVTGVSKLDAHRHALHDLDPVAGGVLRRQQRRIPRRCRRRCWRPRPQACGRDRCRS